MNFGGLPQTLLTADSRGKVFLCLSPGSAERATGGGHWSLLFDFGDGNHVTSEGLSKLDNFIGLELHLGLSMDNEIETQHTELVCRVSTSNKPKKNSVRCVT